MTVAGAIQYLETRLQRVYDGIGGTVPKVTWSGQDAEAVKTLIRETKR